jgi:hypothetical protein
MPSRRQTATEPMLRMRTSLTVERATDPGPAHRLRVLEELHAVREQLAALVSEAASGMLSRSSARVTEDRYAYLMIDA